MILSAILKYYYYLITSYEMV